MATSERLFMLQHRNTFQSSMFTCRAMNPLTRSVALVSTCAVVLSAFASARNCLADADGADALRQDLIALATSDLFSNMNEAAADQSTQPESGRRLRSWELPPVTVVGESPSSLREEERIGPYGQPRWTAARRFPTTRVYVIPEGKVEVEGWAR